MSKSVVANETITQNINATLTVEDRRTLIESVRLVRDLPEVALRSPHLLRGQE